MEILQHQRPDLSLPVQAATSSNQTSAGPGDDAAANATGSTHGIATFITLNGKAKGISGGSSQQLVRYGRGGDATSTPTGIAYDNYSVVTVKGVATGGTSFKSWAY